MIEQGLVQEHSFSFYLTQQDDADGSVLVLGGVDDTYFTGNLTYHDVLTEGLWTIKMDGIAVNGTILTTGTITAIVDSGTSS